MKRWICGALLLAACGGGGSGVFVQMGDLAVAMPGDMAAPPAGDMAVQMAADMAVPMPPDLAVQASCADGQQNGQETDLDCGGPQCGPCADTQKCKVNGDCTSGRCTAGKCVAIVMMPSCNDGKLNGQESDIDCGGGCKGCMNGQSCNGGADCLTGTCTANKCAAPPMKKAVGATCANAADCSGFNAACYQSIGNWATPGGYCGNKPCANDNDCGNGGFCGTLNGAKLCIQGCAAKGACQALNANNRCFNWDGKRYGCLPTSASQCDPTAKGTCNNTGACLRGGFDNVGFCQTVCTLNGNQCANGDACYFNNAQYDLQGMSTMDTFAGLICLGEGGLFEGNACQLLDDCEAGTECDIYGAQKVCRRLCQKGVTACPQGTTCQNAFKVNAFGNNSYGLCL